MLRCFPSLYKQEVAVAERQKLILEREIDIRFCGSSKVRIRYSDVPTQDYRNIFVFTTGENRQEGTKLKTILFDDPTPLCDEPSSLEARQVLVMKSKQQRLWYISAPADEAETCQLVIVLLKSIKKKMDFEDVTLESMPSSQLSLLTASLEALPLLMIKEPCIIEANGSRTLEDDAEVKLTEALKAVIVKKLVLSFVPTLTSVFFESEAAHRLHALTVIDTGDVPILIKFGKECETIDMSHMKLSTESLTQLLREWHNSERTVKSFESRILLEKEMSEGYPIKWLEGAFGDDIKQMKPRDPDTVRYSLRREDGACLEITTEKFDEKHPNVLFTVCVS